MLRRHPRTQRHLISKLTSPLSGLQLAWLGQLIFLLAILPAAAQEPPVIPVGLDGYRMWDHWADQRIGQRAYMRSTYDRTGGKASSNAGNFFFQLKPDANVSLDVEGPGVLYFSRFNHWHGSPWNFIVDGRDHVVKETNTEDPTHCKEPAVFLPEGIFSEPFDYTWTTTKGADLLWTPMEFTQSLRLTYGQTTYGTGYFIYDQFNPGSKLSHSLQSWDNDAPNWEVAALINRSGSDRLPANDSPEAKTMQITDTSGVGVVSKEGPVSVVNATTRLEQIRAIDFSVPVVDSIAFGRASLTIT